MFIVHGLMTGIHVEIPTETSHNIAVKKIVLTGRRMRRQIHGRRCPSFVEIA